MVEFLTSAPQKLTMVKSERYEVVCSLVSIGVRGRAVCTDNGLGPNHNPKGCHFSVHKVSVTGTDQQTSENDTL